MEFLGDSAYLTYWNGARNSAPRAWVASGSEAVLLSDDRNSDDELRAQNASDDSGVRLELLEGRPTFLSLGLTYAENYDWSRYGSALDTPQLPSDLKALEAPFRKCLALRPPRAETEPPAR